MKILTAIAATLYALILWLFAPQNVWDCEVKKAKSKRNKTVIETPQKQLETPQKPEIVEDILTTETPHTAIETPQETPEIETAAKAQTLTVKKLRKIAQTRQIKWKDENGKPLKKNELMRILAI